MIKESDDDYTRMAIEDMEPQDMAMNLIELITRSRFDYDFLRKLLEHAREIYSDPDQPSS